MSPNGKNNKDSPIFPANWLSDLFSKAIQYEKGELPPVKGYVRHQFFWQIDNATWDKLTEDKKEDYLYSLVKNTRYYMLIEDVFKNDKCTVYRLWIDAPQNVTPEFGLDKTPENGSMET
jgi:hypothetical protein